MSDRRPRVVFHGTSSNWGVRLVNPKGIADVIGADVLAALYKCFVGIDRVMAFEHLLYLSQVSPDGKPGWRDTASAERDMHVLFVLLAGTMYELGDALQQLASTKCALKIGDKTIWEPINELRKQWHKDPMASKIRNGFAHHLGDLGDFRRGIENSPDEVELTRNEGERRHGGRFIEPWAALLRAADFDNADFDTFVRKTQAGHESLPDHMIALFAELLFGHGIEVVDEREP